MAESTLSIQFSDLQQEVGFFLGYGTSGWTTAQEAEIDRYIHSGVRQVYYPKGIEGAEAGYEWSWLSPNTQLTLLGPYSTGTVTVASGVVTLVGGTFPSWAADGTVVISSTEYTVDTRDNDNQVTLDDTSLTVASASTYSIKHPPIQDLPDDCGRVVGNLYYQSDQNNDPIVRISEPQMAEFRSKTTTSGVPKYYAERYKSSDGSDGQRKEIIFWPDPDASYVLDYEYEAFQGKLSDSNPYPLGGMKFSELYIESCLSVAEQKAKDEIGLHTQEFQRMLVQMVEQDKQNGSRYYGSMKGPEESPVYTGRARERSTYPISYKGETW